MDLAMRKRYPRDVVRKPLVAVRLPEELLARIDAIVAAVPGLTRPAVTKLAIEEGLAVLEADPRYSGKHKRR